jgi:FixJ family two-component response regulator
LGDFSRLAGERFASPAPAREVFVVDDDQDMRDLLDALFASEGFAVKCFADGDSFLQAAATELPVCVFLDLVMPRRSGLEVLKELRARQFWAPVIMISARDETPLVVEAMKNGAFDYLTKPFDRFAPAARLREALEVWSCRAPAADSTPAHANDADEWVRLTPSEKGALSLMRLMDLSKN